MRAVWLGETKRVAASPSAGFAGGEEAANEIGFGICATRHCFTRRAFFCISVKEISGDNWCLAFSYKHSFYQQAEAAALEGEEYWPIFGLVSSSL